MGLCVGDIARWTFSCGPLNFAFDLFKKARGG